MWLVLGVQEQEALEGAMKEGYFLINGKVVYPQISRRTVRHLNPRHFLTRQPAPEARRSVMESTREHNSRPFEEALLPIPRSGASPSSPFRFPSPAEDEGTHSGAPSGPPPGSAAGAPVAGEAYPGFSPGTPPGSGPGSSASPGPRSARWVVLSDVPSSVFLSSILKGVKQFGVVASISRSVSPQDPGLTNVSIQFETEAAYAAAIRAGSVALGRRMVAIRARGDEQGPGLLVRFVQVSGYKGVASASGLRTACAAVAPVQSFRLRSESIADVVFSSSMSPSQIVALYAI